MTAQPQALESEDIDEGSRIYSAPWWEDFVMDNWTWIAQRATVTDLRKRVDGLLSAIRGDTVGQIRRDFLERGEPFELEDPVIQETVWGCFFEALNRVWEFAEEIRAYHDAHYPTRGTSHAPATPVGV